ncbi:MAG: peptidoglycan-associated lipoprotein Pal [Pelovirga sp.]
MKILSLMRLMVVGLVLMFLAAGCAKQPAVEETVPAQPADDVVVEEQVTSTVQESTISDTAVDTRTAVSPQDTAAEARRAAAAGLQRIHFEFDRSDLTEEAKQILVNNASLLRAAPQVNVLIEGHTDERGSDEYNLALGERRAIAARNFLVSLGVSADRLRIISYGEEMPVALERNEEAWAKNRRAEFKITR